MNKYIIIFIIILIILTLIFFIKKNNEHYSAESLINIFAPCRDVIGGTVSFNNVNINGTLKLGGTSVKTIEQYILDTLFPIDSFYVQYPHTNSKDSDAFPINMSPAKLFGGDWQEQWPEESIFFRTRGPESRENRINGFQGDALKIFVGKSAFNQSNRYNPGVGNSGIFGGGVSTMEIGVDAGKSSDKGHINYFDSAVQSNMSKLETRVRNRQIKVWKRVKRQNNGAIPELPENGYDSQYDNIYFEGPDQNTTFVTPKEFNAFERINSQKAAMKKCKTLGDSCKAIGMINGSPNIYNYSSDGQVIQNDEGDNNTHKVWLKRKSDTVL